MAINYRGTNPQDVSNTSVRLEPVTSYDYTAYDTASGEGAVENTAYWLVPDNFQYSSSVETDKDGGGEYSASYFLIRPINITGSFYGTFSGTNAAVSGSIQVTGSSNFNGPVTISGNTIHNGYIRLDPTEDPGNTFVSSSFLFQSASNTNLTTDLYFRQDGQLIKFNWVTDTLFTGLLYGGVVTYSGSTAYVSSGSGIVVDHNANTINESAATIKYVTWPNLSFTPTYLNVRQVTYLAIDSGSNLVQDYEPFDSNDYVDKIILGAIGHFDLANVTAFQGSALTAYAQQTQTNTFIDSFGPLKLTGYGITAQPSSFKLSIAAGTSFMHGGFYDYDPTRPSNISTAAQATASIAYVYRNGSGGIFFDTNGGAYYTNVTSSLYDDGTGTPASVSNNNWTIQRVTCDPRTGVLYIYYGQNIYATLNAALTNLSTDSFTEGDTKDFTTFLGYLVVKSNTSDISNTTDNSILNGGLFRGIGGGGGAGGGGGTTSPGGSDTQIQYNSSSAFGGSPNFTFSGGNHVRVTGSLTISGSSTFTNIGPTQLTGSLGILGNTTVNGNVTINGTASINYLSVQYETASVIYSSGSNQFGDAANDIQTLYGTVKIQSGSLSLSGSTYISSSNFIRFDHTGSGTNTNYSDLSIFRYTTYDTPAVKVTRPDGIGFTLYRQGSTNGFWVGDEGGNRNMTLYSNVIGAFTFVAPGSGGDFSFTGGDATTPAYASSIIFKTNDYTINAATSSDHSVKIQGPNVTGSNPYNLVSFQVGSTFAEKAAIRYDGGAYFSSSVAIGTGSALYKLDVLSNDSSAFRARSNNHTLYVGDGIYQLGYHYHFAQGSTERLVISMEGGATSTNFGMGLNSLNLVPLAYRSSYNYDTSSLSNGPAFRVFSGDAPATNDKKWIGQYYTGSVGYLAVGSGSLSINPLGNFVGIGTIVPIFNLDVSGSARITNGLTVTGSLTATSFTGSLLGTSSWATNALTASAAGTNRQVQYNSGGVLAATSSFAFNPATALLTVNGKILTNGVLEVSGSSIITGSLQVGIPGTNAAAIDTTVGALSRGNVVTIDWVNRSLYDSSAGASIDWEARTLYDAAAVTSIDWAGRVLYDSGTNSTVDWENRTLFTPGGLKALLYSGDITTNSEVYSRQIISAGVQEDAVSSTTYSGQIIIGTLSGVSNHQLVFLDTDGAWKPTKATVANGAAKMLGVCVDSAKNQILIEGDVPTSDDNTNGAYVVGADHGLPVYISTTTGEMTVTAPSGAGELVRIVGHIYYQSTTDAAWWTMKFRPSNDWYVI